MAFFTSWICLIGATIFLPFTMSHTSSSLKELPSMARLLCMVRIRFALRKSNASDCSIRMAYLSIFVEISAMRFTDSAVSVKGGMYMLMVLGA